MTTPSQQIILAVSVRSRAELIKILRILLVFRKEELVDYHKWNLIVVDGMEIDEFDDEHSTYFLYIDKEWGLVGSFRLRSTMQPNMVKDVFRQHYYLEHKEWLVAPQAPNILESSRLAVDHLYGKGTEINGARRITIQLFMALAEFAHSQGCQKVLTYNRTALERLLKEGMDWKFERLSKKFILPEEMTKSVPKKSIIGFFDTSATVLERARQKTGLKDSILHLGVIPAADLEETLKSLGYSLERKNPPVEKRTSAS